MKQSPQSAELSELPPPLPLAPAVSAAPRELRVRFDPDARADADALVVVSNGRSSSGQRWPTGTYVVALDDGGGSVSRVGSNAVGRFEAGAPVQLGACTFAVGDESLGRDPTVFDRVEWFAPELRVRNHDETRVRFHCRLTGPTHESLVVGRGQQGVDLPVEDHYVSRRHARFFARGGEHLVEDLGSKSGTFVNGQRLEAPHVLKHRDQVRVGNTVLEFHSLAEFARSAAPPQSPSVDASNGGGTREGSVSGTSALAEPRPAESPSRPAAARNWLELGTALLALALLGLSIWRTFHS